jgi:cyclase
MLRKRVIPRLDINKGANVVRGVRLEGLRIIGKSDEIARRYDVIG